MRQWIAVIGVMAALAGCGYDETRLSAKSGFSASLHDDPPANLRCRGLSADEATDFEVLARKDADGKYARVILQDYPSPGDQGPRRLADFDQYRDTTPPPPTDIEFRFVFGNLPTKSEDFTVMLMAGGFTNEATAEIAQYSAGEGTVVADLTCMREF